MSFYKWHPSKTAKREFAKKMQEIDNFCAENNITASRTNDSYYFSLNGVDYRVSNHAPEKSIYRDIFGNEQHYHDSDFRNDTVCINASKTRIIEIYNDLKNGYQLDGNGRRKNNF